MSTATQGVPPEVEEARRKLREKMGTGAQVGGKGSMRRKSKPIPKANFNDERKVGEIAKKGGLQDIGGIDEANIIFTDGQVTQLTQPKVRGSLQANSWVITGPISQTQVSKLSPEMRGDNIQASRGGNPTSGLPPAFQSAALKFKAAIDKAGISEADMSNPEKQGLMMEAINNAGLTDDERRALEILMPQPGAGGASAAGAGADDIPPLSEGKSFEDVADAD